ncbi:MAG: hypothetical protein AABY22_00565 [Nanoarchaeota archaeon]
MSFPKSNTKIFNNLEELWNYCEKCTICSKTREIAVSAGPDDVCKINYINKKNNTLIIDGTLNLRNQKYLVSININCITNKFTFSFMSKTESLHSVDRANTSYLYFYINASCIDSCHITSTVDMELDFNNSIITNFGLEDETVFVQDNEDLYSFYIDYVRENVDIKVHVPGESKNIKNAPFINYDFSDKEKLIQRVKTIITFG